MDERGRRLRPTCRARSHGAGRRHRRWKGHPIAARAGGSAIAVERAVDLLFLLAERGPSSVTALAREAGIGPSTAHRILTALCRKGLAEQERGSDRYELAWGVLTLGRGLGDRADLRTLSLGELQALRDLTGETLTLWVRSGNDRVCAECLESPHELRWIAPVGARTPLHAGASGRVLLSQLEPEELDRYLADAAGEQPAQLSAAAAASLRRAVATARRRGYELAADDRVLGIGGIAAPIGVTACLTIAGPTARCTPQRLAGWLAALRQSTDRINRHLEGARS